MNRAIKSTAAIVLSISMVACISIQHATVGKASGASLSQRQGQRVSIGDIVKVQPKRGVAFTLVVTEVNSERLVGEHCGKVIPVIFSETKSIKKMRFKGMHLPSAKNLDSINCF